MINQKAIDAYLGQVFNSFDHLKAMPEAELDALLQDHGIKPDGMWHHQKVGLAIMLGYDRFMFHMDMGAGKTRLILEYLKHRAPLRTIILVPFLTSIDTWVTQVKQFAPELSCIPLIGTTLENRDQLACTDAQIYVIAYPSAVAMVSYREGENWVLNPDLVGECFQGFNCLVMDEVHKVKNIHSLTYKLCEMLARRCRYTYGLTGTPFGKDLQDLWAQFYLIDWGETLGKSLGFYRSAFFTQKKNRWSKSKYSYEYTFKPKMLPTLHRIIKHTSIRYNLHEFASLEEPLRVPVHLRMPEEMAAYVGKAYSALRAAVKGKSEDRYQLIRSNYLRLWQLSSGFMTLRGEDGDKLELELPNNPKLEQLQAILESLPDTAQVVIFHHFTFSNLLVSGLLDKLGIKHGRVWSGQSDPLGEISLFRDGTYRALVINSRSGSSALNLQFCNYMVFFDQPSDPIDRQQAERRVWRPGQKERVVIYDLFVEDTVDQRIHDSNQAGEDLLKALLDGREI